MSQQKHAILIAGPTASGKSALALALARELGGVVINADSMQLYRDLAILTARPRLEEIGDVPHKLYGTVDGGTACSAGAWSAEAMREAQGAWDAHKIPLFVGGTGLYFAFLLRGVAAIPAIDPAIRERTRQSIAKEGAGAAHQRLRSLDPETAAKLKPNDRQRIARALEVYDSTGKKLSHWHKNTEAGPLAALDTAGRVHKIVLDVARADLYARCDQRFDQMMAMGALDEARALVEAQRDPTLPVMKSLGVRELMACLEGTMTKEEAVETAKRQTRRFAKRQLTWFNNQFSTWERFSTKDYKSSYDKFVKKISKNILTK